MTKLEAINIMLMYINERPVTNTALDILPVTNANICLDEQLKILSYTVGSSVTDIDNANDLVEMYLVRKASFSLFTRMIGFEEKGIDVIKYDIDSTLGNVHEYAYNTVFTGTTYDYAMHFIMSQVSTATSLEQSFNIAKGLKRKIDTLDVPTGITDSNGYKLSVLLLNSGSELGKVEKDSLTASISSATINSVMSDSKYDFVKPYIDSFIKKESVEAITNSITSVKKKIDSTYNKVKALYSYLSDSIIYDYCLVELINATGGEVNSIDRSRLINGIYKTVINSDNRLLECERIALMSIPTEEQNIMTIYDIENNISLAKDTYVTARKAVLKEGWSFNTNSVSLSPNNDGRIIIPTSMLSIYSLDEYIYSVVDWKLYNKEDSTFVFTDAVDMVLVEDVLYDDIVYSVKNMIDTKVIFDLYVKVSTTGRLYSIYRQNFYDARKEALIDDGYKTDRNVLSNLYATELLDMGAL